MGVTVLKKENISDAVIRRLPRYYRQLTDLCARGVVRISSHSLGQEMNITASQIRQDFSCFGEFGQQGYGYNVEELRAEIGHILGVDNDHHLIMIGVGNLGMRCCKTSAFLRLASPSTLRLIFLPRWWEPRSMVCRSMPWRIWIVIFGNTAWMWWCWIRPAPSPRASPW